MAAAAILDFQNLGILGVGRVETAKCVVEPNFKFSSQPVKPLLIYGDFSIFPRWRPSAILDLLCVCSDHPRRAFGGLYRFLKFDWNRYSSFDNMHVFRFRDFGLKTPIQAPKIGVLGGFDPLNGEAHQRDPQKAHPWAERRHMTY